MKKFLFTILIAQSLFTAFLEAKPAQIIILRPGEKIKENLYLSLKGRERAAALAPFLLGTEELLQFGTPAAIYATNQTKTDPSFRTQETMIPLSHALNLPILHPFEDSEYEAQAKEVLENSLYDGKMVLICWEHHHIPPLASALGLENPPAWPNDVFDRLWILTYTQDGSLNFKNVPQRLLFGDSPH